MSFQYRTSEYMITCLNLKMLDFLLIENSMLLPQYYLVIDFIKKADFLL